MAVKKLGGWSSNANKTMPRYNRAVMIGAFRSMQNTCVVVI